MVKLEEKEKCPLIKLKALRSSRLVEFLDKEILQPGAWKSLDDIYHAVQKKFGDDICEPSLFCPHYAPREYPEFWHVIRLALDGGKASKQFINDGKGHWSKLPPTNRRTWFIQFDPRNYDAKLAATELVYDVWRTRVFKKGKEGFVGNAKRLKQGEICLIWESGPDRGIIGYGTVIHEVLQLAFTQEYIKIFAKYYRGPISNAERLQPGQLSWRIPIKYEKPFQQKITLEILRKDPAFKEEYLTGLGTQGTYFPISPEAREFYQTFIQRELGLKIESADISKLQLEVLKQGMVKNELKRDRVNELELRTQGNPNYFILGFADGQYEGKLGGTYHLPRNDMGSFKVPGIEKASGKIVDLIRPGDFCLLFYSGSSGNKILDLKKRFFGYGLVKQKIMSPEPRRLILDYQEFPNKCLLDDIVAKFPAEYQELYQTNRWADVKTVGFYGVNLIDKLQYEITKSACNTDVSPKRRYKTSEISYENESKLKETPKKLELKVPQTSHIDQSKQAHPVLKAISDKFSLDFQEFERKLRIFIASVIEKRFGKGWWDISDGAGDSLTEIKQKTKERMNYAIQQSKKYRELSSHNLFDYLEFSDYARIILSLWKSTRDKPIFSAYFPKESTVEEYLSYLNGHRNSILGHARAVLTDDVIEKVQFYLKDFAKFMEDN